MGEARDSKARAPMKGNSTGGEIQSIDTQQSCDSQNAVVKLDCGSILEKVSNHRLHF